ncbi:MAG TPA: thiamine phosphate synthase [Dehalococcoidia bacterium]|nr:thiamine phosphate synthase [Dehalococcoidia bacterium]
MPAQPALAPPILCFVTDPDLDLDHLTEVVDAAIAGGVSLVQLRLPGRPAGDVLAVGERLLAMVRGRAGLIVNDRIDVALAIGAAGVQLGERSLPVAVARRLIGPDGLIGRSVHSLEGAIEADCAGADFLVLGTIYPTGSHPGAAGAGPDLIRAVTAATSRPVIAIGGITAHNVRAVRQAGAAGAAVITAISRAPDPRRAAADLRAALE